MKWVFSSDMKYAKYVNGILAGHGNYSLEKRNCIHSQEDKLLINFSSSSDLDMMIEKLDSEILDLSDECYDGIGSHRRTRLVAE